jgi:hypothetical protein
VQHLVFGHAGVLGDLAWMFLSGGGLNQLAQNDPPRSRAAAGTARASRLADNDVAGSNAARATCRRRHRARGAGPTITSRRSTSKISAKKNGLALSSNIGEISRQFDVVASRKSTRRMTTSRQLPEDHQSADGRQSARNYDSIIGPRIGNSTQTEQYAFLFNADRIICSQSSKYTVGDPDNLLHREPFVATFATRVNPDEAFTFADQRTYRPRRNQYGTAGAAEAYRVVRPAGAHEDDVIMLGASTPTTPTWAASARSPASRR